MAKVTKDQIAQWKQEHPEGVFLIESKDGKKGYIKAPNRTTLSRASSFLPNDQLSYVETILENCWLGGDEALKTNNKYFLGIMPVIDNVVEVVEAEIKKL